MLDYCLSWCAAHYYQGCVIGFAITFYFWYLYKSQRIRLVWCDTHFNLQDLVILVLGTVLSWVTIMLLCVCYLLDASIHLRDINLFVMNKYNK